MRPRPNPLKAARYLAAFAGAFVFFGAVEIYRSVPWMRLVLFYGVLLYVLMGDRL